MPDSQPIISSLPRAGQAATIASAGFILIGVVNTLLGPVLPMLSARWQLNDAQAGHLFIAQFAGAMLGSAASGALIRRCGFLPSLVGGYGFMSIMIACLSVSSWAVGIVSVFGIGLSLGITIPATNLLISELYPERRAAALNLLNFLWCLGAVTSPPLISVLAHDGGLGWPLGGLAMLLSGIAFLIARYPLTDFSAGLQSADQARFGRSAWRAWTSPYGLLTGGLIFIYVGTETATGGWVASYAQRLGASTQRFWAMAPSIFWVGLLIGRAAAPAALRRVSEGALVLISLFVAVAGLTMILTGNGLMALSVGSGLAGLGLATVFPTTFAIFTGHFKRQASQLAGFVFVLASLGGALIPWSVGFISAQFGALRLGLLVPVFGVALMIALQMAIIWVLARAKMSSKW
jgi:fucose permease